MSLNYCMTKPNLNNEWQTLHRPGFSGRKRDERIANWNQEYGEGNWRLAWLWGNNVIDASMTYQLYEDAYYHDSLDREKLWKELIHEAKDVYDHTLSNIESRLYYFLQEGKATHLQDIAIRRVVLRRGWEFQGEQYVQIRSQSSYWGGQLSPGKVPFHLSELIVNPRVKWWWDDNSIEDFYQSNKVLQVKNQ